MTKPHLQPFARGEALTAKKMEALRLRLLQAINTNVNPPISKISYQGGVAFSLSGFPFLYARVESHGGDTEYTDGNNNYSWVQYERFYDQGDSNKWSWRPGAGSLRGTYNKERPAKAADGRDFVYEGTMVQLMFDTTDNDWTFFVNQIVYCAADDSISAGSSGTASVWELRNGQWQDTGKNITVYVPSFYTTEINAGDSMAVEWQMEFDLTPADGVRGQWVPFSSSGSSSFWAVLFDKVSIQIDPDAADSSDPLFNVPDCPPRLLPLYRGEYSWMEVEPNIYDPGEMKPKKNGRFGIAGECDGAWEINRSNANVHVERMVVRMYRGQSESCLPSSDQQISSDVRLFQSSWSASSTNFRYWFNLAVPREDCANRYVISAHPLNDSV